MIAWMVDTLSLDEAEDYVRLLQRIQPSEVFPTTVSWIRDRVSPERWDGVAARVPEIAS